MAGGQDVTRRLLLLRHAAAEAGHGKPDAERALTPAGRRAAAALADAVADHPPELVLCSPARRTLETAEALGLEPTVEEELYLASTGVLLARLRAVDGAVGSVLLVGHNPGLERLASALSSRIVPLGTAGLAVIDVPGPWASIGRTRGGTAG